MTTRKRMLSSVILSAVVLICAQSAWSQSGTDVSKGDWPDYKGNMAAQAYAPLDQINASNAKSLKVAWRFGTANFGPTPEFNNPSTPLEVNGVLYITLGATRNVAALDATTGELLWMWRPQEPAERFDNAPRKGAGRGVAYWRSGEKKRIFTITPGFTLNSLDADTGIPDPKFGKNGRVDLFVGLRNAGGFKDIDIGNSSPPFVMNNVVVVGPAHKIGMRPRSKSNVKGDVRGFDARTGKLLWTFKTIPEPGQPGSESWIKGLEFTGNAGVWAPMSGDPKLGLLYLPVEAATGDRYGGDRPGNNLYSNSLVAVDIKTGKRRWHYQITHHDIWDWDNPSAPVLADLPNGRKIVMQLTKQSWVFTFDRETGKPIWPIDEKPVPQTDVPGEWTSPTQPFPSRPAPFDLQGFTEANLIDFTPELHTEAKGLLKKFRLSPNLYTPPSLADAADGTTGTLSLPSATGGANWEGSALDPETGILYVPSRRAIAVLSLQKDDKSDIAYSAGSTRVPRVKGLEIVKPPYGSITAIDMNSGEHLWQVPNADTPESIANNPALKGVTLPRTGVPTRSGIVLTKTLLFVGEGEGGGSKLYALDKKTGEIVARIELPNTQSGVPMTYQVKGKQYIALFVSGRGKPTELVALALPTPSSSPTSPA